MTRVEAIKYLLSNSASTYSVEALQSLVVSDAEIRAARQAIRADLEWQRAMRGEEMGG